MKFLLDTHALVWMDSAPNQLSPKVAALISDPNHTILLSYVSVWELQIKIQLGKLQLSKPLATVIAIVSTSFHMHTAIRLIAC